MTDLFTKRIKYFVKRGLQVGSRLSIWLSSIYMLLIFITFFMSSSKVSPSLGEVITTIILGIWFMGILGALPAVILSATGVILISFILGLFKRKLPDFVAGLIGLLVGVFLITLANYLAWKIVYSENPYKFIPFLEFLVPINTNNLMDFVFFENWYFVPSIIAILISPYIGWRINNDQISDNPIETKE